MYGFIATISEPHMGAIFLLQKESILFMLLINLKRITLKVHEIYKTLSTKSSMAMSKVLTDSSWSCVKTLMCINAHELVRSSIKGSRIIRSSVITLWLTIKISLMHIFYLIKYLSYICSFFII